MRKYELMYIVKPDLEKPVIKELANSLKQALTANNAVITEEKEMGQREIAYEMNGYKMGYYFLYYVDANDAKAIEEFSRLARINENVLRHLVVRVDN